MLFSGVLCASRAQNAVLSAFAGSIIAGWLPAGLLDGPQAALRGCSRHTLQELSLKHGPADAIQWMVVTLTTLLIGTSRLEAHTIMVK
jgi:hypothetical protein